MNGPVQQLIALMAQERAALRQGDSGRLTRLARSKARLLATIEAARGAISTAEIDHLRAEAERTAATLRAALDGIKRATEDMARLRDRDERVYHRDGRRDALSVSRHTMARRA